MEARWSLPLPSKVRRSPIDTLNYRSLLDVCGTATNAFLNLAHTAGLPVRRLLLLDRNGGAKHVDAEVLLNGRWFVVDPTFRTILRGPDGRMLTRYELTDPAIFSAATKSIPRYDPNYSFERTAHVHLAGLKFFGNLAGRGLNFLLPGWEDSPVVSLVLERQSLLIVVAAITIVLLSILLRALLRGYGEKHLGIHLASFRSYVQRAYRFYLSDLN